MAIGVGHKILERELYAIASSPEDVFMVDNYEALDRLKDSLAWKACQGEFIITGFQGHLPISRNVIIKRVVHGLKLISTVTTLPPPTTVPPTTTPPTTTPTTPSTTQKPVIKGAVLIDFLVPLPHDFTNEMIS